MWDHTVLPATQQAGQCSVKLT